MKTFLTELKQAIPQTPSYRLIAYYLLIIRIENEEIDTA